MQPPQRWTELEWESTFNCMSDGVTIHDLEYNIVRRNQAFARLFPARTSEPLKCYQIVHGLDAPPSFCPMARMLVSRKSETEDFFEPSIGRHLSVRTDPILDAAGQIHGVVHVVRDTTESKRTEEALQETLRDLQFRQAKIAALLEASRAVLQYREFQLAARAIFDSCKKLIGAAAGYVALLTPDGTENELLFLDPGGQSCTVDRSLPMPIRGLRAKAYQSGKTVYENDFGGSEWLKFMPEGHVNLETVLFAPLKIDGKPVGLLGMANKPGGFTDDDAHAAAAFADLAAIALLNSRMLESLEEHEQRFRSVVETANDGIISVDSHERIVYWNPTAETMFGYSAAEVMGQPLTWVIPGPSREFLSTMEGDARGTIREVTGHRKDGTGFPVELSLAAWKTGEGVFFTGICRDITARKRAEAEIRRLNSHLEHRAAELADANRELEAFTYSVSHDLRAPLRHIDGFSRLLLEAHAAGSPEQVRHYLDRIRDAIRKMGALVDGLLDLSRLARKEISLRVTALNPLVEELLADLKPETKGREIEWRIGPLPFVECDPALMKQVFANLLSNAVKFSRPRERAVIEVGALSREGQAPVVFVRDNGVGFSLSHAHKLFGVFQRLHRTEDFEGTGIGLATVQRIIHRHGGRLWAEAEVGRGATFYFTLGPEANPSA